MRYELTPTDVAFLSSIAVAPHDPLTPEQIAMRLYKRRAEACEASMREMYDKWQAAEERYEGERRRFRYAMVAVGVFAAAFWAMILFAQT